jgi:glycyl-tRNA synthetase
MSMKIFNDLRHHFYCFHEEKDAIGKRYRRQDAIGTPYCITVDHQTLEDNTVTLRERDSMEQTRIDIAAIRDIVEKKVDMAAIH